MKIKWGTLGIIIALFAVAASIFFASIRIPEAISLNVQELKEKGRREAISFIYAFRKSSHEGRGIIVEDIKEGYNFADSFLKFYPEERK
ncbi:MAG: hypothetical protein U9O41_09020 [Candidatus Aerophobetes bacterium]|nr:hypothetical protein [Candidatus Aerophobetes bacterium]